MKKRITTLALVAITSFTSQLFAQEVSAVAPAKASYDLKKNVKARVSQTDGKTMAADDWDANSAKAAQGQHIKKAILVCRVTPTDNGCVVTLEHDVKSPRDAASGLPTGKRMQKPLSVFVSASDNSVSEVKSPRDAASGLPTGKRMHKPFVITKELDKSSPQLSETVSKNREASATSISEIVVTKSVDKSSPKLSETVAKGREASAPSLSEISIDEPGVHKVAMQDMHFTITCGGKTTQIDCVDGRCEIPVGECPNGACSAIASWSWGATNTGSSGMGGGSGSGRCAVDFFLEIEDGACTAVAINEKGLPGEKKPNTTTTNNPK